MIGLSNILLRRWRLLATLTLVGGALGAAYGLLTPRTYTADALFVPQGPEAPTSQLALAASQFGLSAGHSNAWGPDAYVELVESRAVLEPLVRDTTLVVQGRSLAQHLDLAEVPEPLRARRGITEVASLVEADKLSAMNGVRLRVTTQSPELSFEIARRLLTIVNGVNLSVRQGQARAEREFVEEQAARAEVALRTAEDRLQNFLAQNRALANSPQLTFTRDRLNREVMLRQQLYTSWLQNREDVRMRAQRDVPVITVVEPPRLPALPNPRGLVTKAVFGALGGALLAALVAVLAELLAQTRSLQTEETREFFGWAQRARPRLSGGAPGGH